MKFKLEFTVSDTYAEGLKQTMFYQDTFKDEDDQEEKVTEWLIALIKNACHPFFGNRVEINEVE
jgi:hypothetical protein